MPELNLIKVADKLLVGADPGTDQTLDKIPVNSVLVGDFRKVRNPKFHRKFFELLRVGYDLWDPPPPTDPRQQGLFKKYGAPAKNFDHFRDQITILAGYYESSFNLDGTIRVVPKSISFAKMDETEFEALYSKVIDVLLAAIPPGTTAEELREAADKAQEIMHFA